MSQQWVAVASASGYAPVTQTVVVRRRYVAVVERQLPSQPCDFNCQVSAVPGATQVSVDVSWELPANVAEADVHHHVVVLRRETAEDEAGAALCRTVVPRSQTTVRLASIPTGQRYLVSVSAVGAIGEGPACSARITVPAPQTVRRVAAHPHAAPGGQQPSSEAVYVLAMSSRCLEAAAASAAESASAAPQQRLLRLQWQPCRSSRPEDVEGYRIWSRTEGSGEAWRLLVEHTGSAEPEATCALSSAGGAEQEFSVEAIVRRSPTPCRQHVATQQQQQLGAAAEASSSTAAGAAARPPPPPARRVSLADCIVQNLTAVEDMEASASAGSASQRTATIRLHWEPPPGFSEGGQPDIQCYEISVLRGLDADRSRPIHTTRVVAPTTRAIMAGFARGCEYKFIVLVTTSAGAGGAAECTVSLPLAPEPEEDAPPASPAVAAPGSNGAGAVASAAASSEEPSPESPTSRGLSSQQRAFSERMHARWTNSDAENLVLPLSRETLFDDTVTVLGTPEAAVEYLQEHQVLHVQFEGEAGVDEGGLLREWLCLVFREASNQQRGVFEHIGDHHIWPSAVAWRVATEDAEPVLRSLGRLLGIALASGSTTGFCIHPIFWKYVLATCRDGAEDVDYFMELQHFDREQFLQRARLAFYSREELAAALAVSVERLDIMLPDWQPFDEACVEALDLAWEYDETVCGTHVSTALRRPGATEASSADSCVTKREAREYLQLWARQRIIGSVEAQLEVLREGLFEVVPLRQLAALTAAELCELAVGREHWSIEELLPHIDVLVVRDASGSNNAISAARSLAAWLGTILRDFSEAQREEFLQYVTGSARLPAGGPAALRPRLTLQVMPSWTTDALPVAHTCINLLDIPLYPDVEMLRARLLTALHHGGGTFGIA
eukprot:TRINITY_DN101601_c0_g1_i1.p1 TRINITY_DN101601_c0_g1~~TRINITY_DN101601_c0_g1_i1.p1  ORF type:complete len:897 (+),score=221.09 TRINITY_DN101601_c0_g1_i1:80-2770(+)